MKCLCGYETDDSYFAPPEEEKFIHLNVAFLRENDYDRYNNPQPSALYACPKCGTVKVDYP